MKYVATYSVGSMQIHMFLGFYEEIIYMAYHSSSDNLTRKFYKKASLFTRIMCEIPQFVYTLPERLVCVENPHKVISHVFYTTLNKLLMDL